MHNAALANPDCFKDNSAVIFIFASIVKGVGSTLNGKNLLTKEQIVPFQSGPDFVRAFCIQESKKEVRKVVSL